MQNSLAFRLGGFTPDVFTRPAYNDKKSSKFQSVLYYRLSMYKDRVRAVHSHYIHKEK